MDGLDEQRLLGAAAVHFGVQAPLDRDFVPAWRALLQALRDEAELSPVAAWRASARLLSALGQRASLRELEATTPEVREHPVDDPIFITGWPHAATHLLHNTLARVPGLWAPRLWELQAPIPPARIDERWVDRQIRATEAMLEQFDLSGLGVGPLRATQPDACSWLFRNNFSSLAHALHWFVPSYAAFMRSVELTPAYRDHRRWLRVLAWRHRHDELGPRIVLEDPWHAGQLDALFSVYPCARVVQVHCDPLEATSTLARTCWSLQQKDARRVRSRDEIGHYCTELLADSLRSNANARQRLGSARIIDVSAHEVLADPLAVVRSLGRRLQVPISEAALRPASRWLLDTGHLTRRQPTKLDDLRPA